MDHSMDPPTSRSHPARWELKAGKSIPFLSLGRSRKFLRRKGKSLATGTIHGLDMTDGHARCRGRKDIWLASGLDSGNR